MEESIMNLEVKVAFQEHQIGELNEVIREMADRIDEMQRDLRSLKETVSAQQKLGGADEGGVEAQVQLLVQQATDELRLMAMPPSWRPWL